MTGACWLSTGADQTIREEAARHPLAETGGVLLGYYSPDGSMVVADATGPGAGALRTADSFHPDVAWQRAEIAARYAASGRINTYLGDWHTHPGGVPLLSPTDVRTLRRIARTAAARAPHPLMAILAPDADGSLAVWQHRGRLRAPRRLQCTAL
jgi:integrative and conjugative element protein (TIGR02256 family)